MARADVFHLAIRVDPSVVRGAFIVGESFAHTFGMDADVGKLPFALPLIIWSRHARHSSVANLLARAF